MNKKRKFSKRKVLLINPKFQLSVIRQFFFLLIVVLITIAVIFWWQYSPLLEAINTVGLDDSHPFMVAFDKFHFMMLIILICCSIFAFCMFYIAALIISNRVAGPLYHLITHLRSIREGTRESDDSTGFPRIKFRTKDYFQEVADEINRFFDFVQKK